MPTRKIRDLAKEESCTHPEHDPPKHMVYSEGVWEHICPGCGRRIEWTERHPRYVSRLRWMIQSELKSGPRHIGANRWR